MFDLADCGVREFLDLFFGGVELVLGDGALFLHFFGRVDSVAACRSDANARFFRHLFDAFHEVAASLFRERGDREADELSVGGRVDPEFGLFDGSFDVLGGAAVEGLDDDQASFWGGDECQLFELHH